MLCKLVKNIREADIPGSILLIQGQIPCHFEIEQTGIMRMIYKRADLERTSKDIVAMKNLGIPVSKDVTE